ncbi:MAG: hypothetical protein AB1349_03815 [Elusimicrobiota bacterium]
MENREYQKIENLLIVISKFLSGFKSTGIINSYGLIGGLGVGAIGIPRATKNVDFLISTENIGKFYVEFRKLFNTKSYSIELKKPEQEVFPYYAIICYKKERGREKKSRIVDILISTLNWQDEICKDTVLLHFARQSIPVVNTEGQIILKLKAGGPMDIIDIENILKVVNKNKLNLKKLSNWAKRSGTTNLLNKILGKK